eukprot:m.73627 g.73627  ORF g.73627 m.73627 type:complete len:109 (-) comp11776_c1_seq9:25-351(-)
MQVSNTQKNSFHGFTPPTPFRVYTETMARVTNCDERSEMRHVNMTLVNGCTPLISVRPSQFFVIPFINITPTTNNNNNSHNNNQLILTQQPHAHIPPNCNFVETADAQ